ncbi:hypothetical protein GCM10022402_05630 [Salinactinospora qingdaonensis]|uniref:Uncharacterized protein n=1 Tax=Salinactinospora qingdaonensis TaxID=702744 RepID=A0ABP7EZN9_9ACTN
MTGQSGVGGVPTEPPSSGFRQEDTTGSFARGDDYPPRYETGSHTPTTDYTTPYEQPAYGSSWHQQGWSGGTNEQAPFSYGANSGFDALSTPPQGFSSGGGSFARGDDYPPRYETGSHTPTTDYTTPYEQSGGGTPPPSYADYADVLSDYDPADPYGGYASSGPGYSYSGGWPHYPEPYYDDRDAYDSAPYRYGDGSSFD